MGIQDKTLKLLVLVLNKIKHGINVLITMFQQRFRNILIQIKLIHDDPYVLSHETCLHTFLKTTRFETRWPTSRNRTMLVANLTSQISLKTLQYVPTHGTCLLLILEQTRFQVSSLS